MEKNDWLAGIRSGEREAFRQLYEAYAGYAIRTASAITRNREMAKDAVQETFIRIYRHRESYNQNMPFDPWFYRILTNECIRLLKKDSHYSTFQHPSQEQDTMAAAATTDSLSDLYEEIQLLEDLYRIPLILKYLKGFSEKEIAEIMELNLNTVKSRLFKGRKQLKERLSSDKKEMRP